MRIAIYQCEPGPAQVDRNLDRLARVAKHASAQGVTLLVCPEMYLTGYNIGADAVRRLAEPSDGPSAHVVAEIARENSVAIVYGYPERRGEDAVFNSAQLLSARGTPLANYRKTHLFGDLDKSMFWASDADSAVIELDGWRVGMLICYDLEFPENARKLALRGVDLIVTPTANMVPFDVIATTIVPARAYENQVYVAYANYCGSESGLEYCGLSCVAAPDGSDEARAGRGEELISCQLDHERLTESRGTATYLADRRPPLYTPLSSPTPECEE
jgi:predicted amidohydrolase